MGVPAMCSAMHPTDAGRTYSPGWCIPPMAAMGKVGFRGRYFFLDQPMQLKKIIRSGLGHESPLEELPLPVS